MISVCIITKNERKFLSENLQILKKYPCEVVVVDTGSTDGSIEVAKKYANIFGEYEWCDDFASAKNYAVSLASNSVIAILDTDEYIQESDFGYIEKKLSENPYVIGRMKCLSPHFIGNEQKVGIDYISRIFDRRYYHFEGRIHEQLVLNKDKNFSGYAREMFDAPLVVRHLGYLQIGEEKHQKAKRNINLLRKELTENPDDCYILYQLGKAYMYDDDEESALSCFEQTFEKELNAENPWVIDLIVNVGGLYISTGQKEKALTLECLDKEFPNSSDYHFMMGCVCMQNALFDRAIEYFIAATRMPEGQIEGNNSYNAFYNIGVIYECLGNIQEAIIYYMKCGNFNKAVEGIKRLTVY